MSATSSTALAARLAATTEGARLEATARGAGWRRWGTYVSDRQWGTVREDYSPGGTAWDYFPHDLARSRAYRWGEDAIGGFCDEYQRWCLGVALWNGRDPILKERLFGLTNSEGNHGEDVKEWYAHLDGVPSHAYMRMVYRYPHAPYPYEQLLRENARRGLADPEYELDDTGVLADGRFFDVTIEYAKADTDDILMRITVDNRAAEPATLWLLPQFWGRNTWSWNADRRRARIRAAGERHVVAERAFVAPLSMEADNCDEVIFCENETNTHKLYGFALAGPYKDGFDEYVVHGLKDAIARDEGSKCGFLRRLDLAAGASATMRLRLRPQTENPTAAFDDFDAVFARRIAEADEFYDVLQTDIESANARFVQRRAFAGMLWSKQFYFIDIPRWIDGDPTQPKPPPRTRNIDWEHLNNADVISMPDKWEYPWYAAWDLAFHCIAFVPIDATFAKAQLKLLTREWYMHPNGQLPAYEWAFDDVNPPVHAWAVLRVFEMERAMTGQGDRVFLEGVFHKLLMNFTWWVNRKDKDGRNIFQGGFLGLDNIGLFDRSTALPNGQTLDQSDGTAWMAMYALNMLRIALELAPENPVYEDLATKFFEHFLTIAGAMTDIGGKGLGLWDEEDGFFYDVLRSPNGDHRPMRVRSIVGLIPIFAVEILQADTFARFPEFARRSRWFLSYRPDLAALVSRWTEAGAGDLHLLSLLRGHRLKCLLRYALDVDEFLSPHGIRGLSKVYEHAPYTVDVGGAQLTMTYAPGDSLTKTFGGNSNWRGPVWMPINYLLIDSLRRFHSYYGDDFKVECPTRSGKMLSLCEVADELSGRLIKLFMPDAEGHRPSQPRDGAPLADGTDPLFFNEYFHGDNGRGLGASHQTGWTGLVAMLIRPESVARACAGPSDPR